MPLAVEDEARIRREVAAIDDVEFAGLLKGDLAVQSRFWADDLIVNAPTNEIVHRDHARERQANRSGLSYASFERHREATVVRAGCAVTMGHEVVVPKPGAPDAGRKITRRYTNVWALDDGRWRLIARQVTNTSTE
jgi:hypothetical protein